MSREITTHQVEGAANGLTLKAHDEDRTTGGAPYRYTISSPGKPLKQELMSPSVNVELQFQNGPIPEVGVNGLTQEVLLAVVIDRLEGFQAGPFACDDNAEALGYTQKALEFLQKRTKDRIDRGVEGKLQS